MSNVLDKIKKENEEYERSLELLRVRLFERFSSDPAKAELLDELSDESSTALVSLFNVMFKYCRGVSFLDGVPKREYADVFDKWDGRTIAICGEDDLAAAVAIGYASPMTDNSTVLCAPPSIDDARRAQFERIFDVCLGSESTPSPFKFKTFDSSIGYAPPDWAYYMMSQVSLRNVMLSILHKSMVTFSTNSYVDIESLEVDLPAFMRALSVNTALRKDMLEIPISYSTTDKWRKDAISFGQYKLSEKDPDMALMLNIAQLWMTMCDQNKISTVFTPSNISDEKTIRENIGKLGVLLGIEPCIQSLVRGVPLEDILA